MIKNRTIGFYLILLAGVLGIISAIRYLLWAPANNSMDYVIIFAFFIAIVMDLLLMRKENTYVMILGTICYSIAGVKILTNSVGSFVDAFQGINMFGDATQVGMILSIAIIEMFAVLLSIAASFFALSKSK